MIEKFKRLRQEITQASETIVRQIYHQVPSGAITRRRQRANQYCHAGSLSGQATRIR